MPYPTAAVAGDQILAADFNDFSMNPTYTYGETLAVGDAVYLKASDSKIYKADADVQTQIDAYVGIVAVAGVLNDTNRIFAPGKIATGLSGLTAGTVYYLSNTAGGLSATTGTIALIVGVALSTTTLLVLRDTKVNPVGDGSDGAFAQSSGTTTLNTASKTVYQYTSFALTGTADLATGANLDNKPLLILVQGDLTVTSSTVPAVIRKGKGGGGGTAGTLGAGGDGTEGGTIYIANQGGGGSTGNSGYGGGGGGGYGNAGAIGGAGVGGTQGTAGAKNPYATLRPIFQIISHAFIGGGGGGGGMDSSSGNDGGAGGNGGGSIIFIVGGNINITSTFNCSGGDGTAAPDGTNSGGGGGGGGGGFIGIFYKGSVTANTATFTVAGGAGGASGDGGAGGAGGAGQSEVRQIVPRDFIF